MLTVYIKINLIKQIQLVNQKLNFSKLTKSNLYKTHYKNLAFRRRVPPRVVIRPQLEVPRGGDRQYDVVVVRGRVQRVEKVPAVGEDHGPKRPGFLGQLQLHPFPLAVAEESTEQAGVKVVEDEYEEFLVELERSTELFGLQSFIKKNKIIKLKIETVGFKYNANICTVQKLS